MSTFAIVAEPTRRRILDLLRERARSVGELVAEVGLSQPGVSKHLRVLRELDDWLEPYRLFWSERLDDLERHLDTGVNDDGEPPAG